MKRMANKRVCFLTGIGIEPDKFIAGFEPRFDRIERSRERFGGGGELAAAEQKGGHRRVAEREALHDAYLDGGAGADTIYGGKSGDQIVVSGNDMAFPGAPLLPRSVPAAESKP